MARREALIALHGEATGATRADLCTACFTGDHLVPVQLELTKESLERQRAEGPKEGQKAATKGL